MKITPLEIRQKSFEKHFRGYDKDEVNAFLLTLSQEWERIVDESKEWRIKLEAAEREVTKLREVENSLFKTLKTAEDTGANVIEQARQAADLHLRESQLKADEMINEAKMKANDTVDEAEQRAKEVLADMEERLRNMIEEYKKMQLLRNDMLLDLKRISEDTLERVQRISKTQHDFNPDKHLADTRKEIKKIIFPNQETPAPQSSAPVVKKEPVVLKPAAEPEPQMVVARETVVVESRKKLTSFFDEIG
jgi:cell division initiation protein